MHRLYLILFLLIVSDANAQIYTAIGGTGSKSGTTGVVNLTCTGANGFFTTSSQGCAYIGGVFDGGFSSAQITNITGGNPHYASAALGLHEGTGTGDRFAMFKYRRSGQLQIWARRTTNGVVRRKGTTIFVLLPFFIRVELNSDIVTFEWKKNLTDPWVVADTVHLPSLSSPNMGMFAESRSASLSSTIFAESFTFTEGNNPPLAAIDLNPTGDPIGGFIGYSNIITTGDYTPTNLTEFNTALASCSGGETIYIAEADTIALGTSEGLILPCGCTLASDRGRSKGGGLYSQGGLITSTMQQATANQATALETPNEGGVGLCNTITGLRLRGPLGEIGVSPDDDQSGSNVAGGLLRTWNDSTEFYNNQVVGWDKWGIVSENDRIYIHHNYFGATNRSGYGYPIYLNGTLAGGTNTPTIEANQFDGCRHCIGDSGDSDAGLLTVRYNIFGPSIVNPTNAIINMVGNGGRDFAVYRNLFSSLELVDVADSNFQQIIQTKDIAPLTADSVVFRDNYILEAIPKTYTTLASYSLDIIALDADADSVYVFGNKVNDFANTMRFRIEKSSGGMLDGFYDIGGTSKYTVAENWTAIPVTQDIPSTIASGTITRGSVNIVGDVNNIDFSGNAYEGSGVEFPIPAATFNQTTCTAPCTVTITENGSVDPDDADLVWWIVNWDDEGLRGLGDFPGRKIIGREDTLYAASGMASHQYNTAGRYNLALTAVNEFGVRGTTIYTITIQPASGTHWITFQPEDHYPGSATGIVEARLVIENITTGSGWITAWSGDVASFERQTVAVNIGALTTISTSDVIRVRIGLAYTANSTNNESGELWFTWSRVHVFGFNAQPTNADFTTRSGWTWEENGPWITMLSRLARNQSTISSRFIKEGVDQNDHLSGDFTYYWQDVVAQ